MAAALGLTTRLRLEIGTASEQEPRPAKVHTPEVSSRSACEVHGPPLDVVDDVHEHPLAVTHRGGLDDRAQRAGGPPATPDHAAVVVRCDRKLEHDRTVALSDLGHAYLLRLVYEAAREVLEQLLRRRRVGRH